MGFKFRYETLLSYREHLKEKAEIELGKAQAQRNRARQLLEHTEKRLRDAGASLEKQLTAKMSSEEMITYSEYLAGLRRRISAQKIDLARLDKIVAEKRKNLLTRSKEYRIIEKLKEKDLKRWTHQQSLQERERMNEVAITRFGREFI